MADVYRLSGTAVVRGTTADIWRYSGVAVIAQYGTGATEARVDVIESPLISAITVYEARIDIIEGPGVAAPPAPDLRLPVQLIAY